MKAATNGAPGRSARTKDSTAAANSSASSVIPSATKNIDPSSQVACCNSKTLRCSTTLRVARIFSGSTRSRYPGSQEISSQNFCQGHGTGGSYTFADSHPTLDCATSASVISCPQGSIRSAGYRFAPAPTSIARRAKWPFPKCSARKFPATLMICRSSGSRNP